VRPETPRTAWPSFYSICRTSFFLNSADSPGRYPCTHDGCHASRCMGPLLRPSSSGSLQVDEEPQGTYLLLARGVSTLWCIIICQNLKIVRGSDALSAAFFKTVSFTWATFRISVTGKCTAVVIPGPFRGTFREQHRPVPLFVGKNCLFGQLADRFISALKTLLLALQDYRLNFPRAAAIYALLKIQAKRIPRHPQSLVSQIGARMRHPNWVSWDTIPFGKSTQKLKILMTSFKLLDSTAGSKYYF
jgi:hypothetical protein